MLLSFKFNIRIFISIHVVEIYERKERWLHVFNIGNLAHHLGKALTGPTVRESFSLDFSSAASTWWQQMLHQNSVRPSYRQSSLFLLNWASACGPSPLSFDFIWTWHSLDLFTHSSFGLGLRLNPSGLLMRY